VWPITPGPKNRSRDYAYTAIIDSAGRDGSAGRQTVLQSAGRKPGRTTNAIRLPAIFANRGNRGRGGFMSYGADLDELIDALRLYEKSQGQEKARRTCQSSKAFKHTGWSSTLKRESLGIFFPRPVLAGRRVIECRGCRLLAVFAFATCPC